MRLFPVILLLGLTACDTAGPGFSGLPKTTHTVDGATFTLRQRGPVVEAIRTNPEMLPRFQSVAPKAGVAAQLQTGCTAEWVVGDPAMMWVGLSCDGQRAPKRPKKPRSFACELFYSGQNVHELECL